MTSSLNQGETGRSRTFEIKGQTYQLTRLGNHRYVELWKSSIAIQGDSELEYALYRYVRLGLAETYAACRQLFGERGTSFDDWKGGFGFPLALDVPRAARRPAYVLNVLNFRGGLEYRLRMVVDSADERLAKPYYYPPEPDEFSCAEIRLFTLFFVGYLEGYVETLPLFWKERFLLAVESNLILFGFDGDAFFTRQFESPDEFDATRTALAQRLPTPGFYAAD